MTAVSELLRSGTVWLGGCLTTKVRGGFNSGLRWTLFPYSAYWRGTAYEQDTVSAIKSYVRSGGVSWDVGAHFGFYSLMMARQGGPHARVYAFEPEPLSFARLQKHIYINNLESRVRCFKLAASGHDRQGKMFSGGGKGVTTTHFRYIDEPAFAESATITVNTARMDTLVEHGQVLPPSFVKIDVEGHAGACLQGARQTIEQARPVVHLSTHGPDESRAIAEFFKRLDYRARWSLSEEEWRPEDARAEQGVIMLP